MAWVVAHPRHPLDDPGDAGKGPQVRVESVSPCSLSQTVVDPRELLAVKFSFATRSSRPAQRGNPAALPVSVPAKNALAARPYGASHRRHYHPAPKHLRGISAALFEGLEISPGTHVSFHASKIPRTQTIVTVLCEVQ